MPVPKKPVRRKRNMNKNYKLKVVANHNFTKKEFTFFNERNLKNGQIISRQGPERRKLKTPVDLTNFQTGQTVVKGAAKQIFENKGIQARKSRKTKRK